MKTPLHRTLFLLLALNIFLCLFPNQSSADTYIMKDGCDGGEMDFLAHLYFATDNPNELFEILAKNTGKYSPRGEWEGNSNAEKEFVQLLQKNAKTSEKSKILLENWRQENKEFLSRFQGRKSPINKCFLYLQIDGEITQGDVITIRNELREFTNPPFIYVDLNSTGGEVHAAMEIGRIVRNHYGITAVGKHYNFKKSQDVGCYSACVLIYAAGIAKDIQIKKGGGGWYPVGVHQHFLPSGAVEQLSVEEGIQYLKQTKREISQYLDEMGVPQEFLTLASSINQNKVHLLNTRELKLFLPFAVGEYSAVIPIKIEQALNNQRNLFQKLMVVVIENVGDGAELIDYLMEAERILLDNFEVTKWATGPRYYIERGVSTQNYAFKD